MVIDKRLLLMSLALSLCLNSMASATPVFIELTTNALGLGSTDINHAGNDSPIEADRPGQLVTSTAANVGSILHVQTDNLAGQGTSADPLLVSITARSHLSVQNNLPAGYDLHAGAITITNDDGDIKDQGLGVRAFGIDTGGTAATNPDFGKRYVNPAFVAINANGYQMEGSKEISGGVGISDFDVFSMTMTFRPRTPPLMLMKT